MLVTSILERGLKSFLQSPGTCPAIYSSWSPPCSSSPSFLEEYSSLFHHILFCCTSFLVALHCTLWSQVLKLRFETIHWNEQLRSCWLLSKVTWIDWSDILQILFIKCKLRSFHWKTSKYWSMLWKFLPLWQRWLEILIHDTVLLFSVPKWSTTNINLRRPFQEQSTRLRLYAVPPSLSVSAWHPKFDQIKCVREHIWLW